MGGPERLSYNRQAMRVPVRGFLVVLAASLATAATSPAETPSEDGAKTAQPAPQPSGGAAPEKTIDLDTLLHPSASALQPSGKILGGRDEKGWQAEFKRARQEVSDLEGKIEAEQNKMRNISGGDWQYTPAGGEATDPEVLKLRATLKRDRQSLEASRQRLRDLDVEASLAGVPEDWKKPAP